MNQEMMAAIDGFGTSSANDLAELSKALEAGYTVGLSGRTGGSALRVESLEGSLKVITFKMGNLKMWSKIPKTPAYSTVEEYNELSSYGNDQGAFLPEGEAPEENDSEYTRKANLVKYLGTTRKVTHPMSLVKVAHGDVIANENKNGILWLLKQANNSLYFGNSKLKLNGAESEEFDGLQQLIAPETTIDLKGGILTESVMNAAADLIVQNYGTPTDLFASTNSIANFVNTLYPRERFGPMSGPTADGKVGQRIKGFDSQSGFLEFQGDVFIRKTPTAPSTAKGIASKLPTAVTVATAAMAGTGGEFAKSLGASASMTVAYKVTAGNRYGETAASAATGNVTVALADAEKYVPLTITNADPQTIAPDWFGIYRSDNGGQFMLIAKIATSSATAGGTTTFNDKNIIMPGTEEAFLGEMSQDVYEFRQLAPLMKMDLAILGPAYRWMILLYGTPVLYAKRKWVRFTNIGNPPIGGFDYSKNIL